MDLQYCVLTLVLDLHWFAVIFLPTFLFSISSFHPPRPPLQSESRFGSSTHRTPRWALSSTPSTPWRTACTTCSGCSAQGSR